MKKLGVFSFSLVLFICLLIILFFISERFSPVYPLIKKRKTNFSKVAKGITILSLGNSHAGAINFETLGMKGFHYWDAAEDIFETAYKVQNIIEKCPQLQIVCIPISPYSPYQNNKETFYHIQYHPRVRLHVATNSWQPLQGKLNFLLLGKLSPLVRYDHWVFLPKLLSNKQTKNIADTRLDSLESNGLWHFKYPVLKNEDQLAQLAEKNIKEHSRLLNDTSQQVIFWQTLKEIKTYLYKQNIQLYIYTPPYYKAYLELLDQPLYNQTIAEAKQFTKENEITYSDFSKDSYLSPRWQFFDDASHLNQKGREIFSLYVKADLEKLKPFSAKENGFKNAVNK